MNKTGYWFLKVQYFASLSCTLLNISPSQHGLPCKFVLAEDKNLSANLCNYLALIFWSAMLQNVLNNIVTILILQEAVEV